MASTEQASLILDFARILYVNGQSTDRVQTSVEGLANALGQRAQLCIRWGELKLVSDETESNRVWIANANPSGINMHRVAAAESAIDDIREGRLKLADAKFRIEDIASMPAAPVWLFALAAALGAAALAALFGVQHLDALGIIIASAAIGALLRRAIATRSDNLYIQPFCAALLAGLIGAVATRYQLSSSLRLIAVCPCMILVPGPHVLNGMMDLLTGRIPLGAARLLYAGLVILAISTGLLLGLSLLGVSLPVEPEGRSVLPWTDVLAAGVAVSAYSIYFSTPLKMLAWPIAVGMLAHALRWLVLTELGANVAAGAFIACFAVGLILTPVAHQKHMLFAAIGFASVVSMMPGVFLFRMISGLVQLDDGAFKKLDLISGTLSDAFTATTIIFAMGLGLILPHLIIERVLLRSHSKH